MTKPHALYLCNGADTKCNYKVTCGVKNPEVVRTLGGACTRTFNIAYAKNFKLEVGESGNLYVEKKEEER
jgi:hypothetical protein